MLTKIDALKDGDYRFFKSDTGHEFWKVKLVKNQARPALVVADVDLATTEFSVTVTVSPVDDSGSALRDNADLPIVIDSHTHVFNEVEQRSPDYDPQARIMTIVEERIEAGQAVLAGNRRLGDLLDSWAK